MLTRLQANSTQSTELATCSGANPPRRPLNFRQGSPVVDDNPDEAGGPSSLLASRSSAVPDFSIYKCRNNYVKFVLNYTSFFYSNVTGKKQFTTNPSFKNVTVIQAT